MVNLDYLYNPNAVKPHFNENCFSDKKLSFQVIEHGTILPNKKSIEGQTSKDYWGFGGIVEKNGIYVKSSSLHLWLGSVYTPPP